MISLVDRFLSHSIKNGLTFLKSAEAYTSKSTSLLLHQDRFLCTFTNIQERCPHFTHPPELTFISGSFSYLFKKILFCFPFHPRHVPGFGQWCLGMIRKQWKWDNNPNVVFISLSCFSDKKGTEQKETRGILMLDPMIRMNQEDWKRPAHNICCSSIEQWVRAEATLHPAVSRKTMSIETIAHILHSLQNIWLFFFYSVNSMLQGWQSFCYFLQLVKRKLNNLEALLPENQGFWFGEGPDIEFLGNEYAVYVDMKCSNQPNHPWSESQLSCVTWSLLFDFKSQFPWVPNGNT